VTLLSGTESIGSERLILRRIDQCDLGFFTQTHADPDVARYIGTGQPRSDAETQQWLASILHGYTNADLGQLAVVRKEDGAILGRCGLSDSVVERSPADGAIRKGWFFSHYAPPDLDVQPVPEFGYTFAKQHWGQGYASEAARTVFDYIRQNRSIPKVMSVIHTDNRASLGVVQKFGVGYLEPIEMAGRVFDRYDWPTTHA
jgi:[ribosomal protein S5]-alanine N-acetyltransferase